MVSGDVTGAQANLNSRLGAGVLNDPALFSHFGTGFTLSQLITDSGRTHNLVSNARLQARASQADYQATQYDVLLGVNQAYYEVLLAEQLVKVAQQTVSTRQTVVDQVLELTKNKLKSDVDLSFAQVNLSDAKLMLLRAQDRIASAYAALGQALGSQQSVPYQPLRATYAAGTSTRCGAAYSPSFSESARVGELAAAEGSRPKICICGARFKPANRELGCCRGRSAVYSFGEPNANIPAGYEAAAVNIHIPVFNGHLFSARRQAAEYQLSLRSSAFVVSKTGSRATYEPRGSGPELLMKRLPLPGSSWRRRIWPSIWPRADTIWV